MITFILTYLFIVIPSQILSIFIVPILLLTKWDGKTTIFGNAKHGRGVDHGAIIYWQQLIWLVFSNPVNNLLSFTLATPCTNYTIKGDSGIGDATRGGFYKITMGHAWEYYWIKPYGKRCIRLRIGWKINGKQPMQLCEYVLTFNPLKPYTGQ